MDKTAFDRLALLAVDVQRAARTFKQVNSKFATNTSLRSVVSRAAVADTANELYFAARSAWREALKVEGR